MLANGLNKYVRAGASKSSWTTIKLCYLSSQAGGDPGFVHLVGQKPGWIAALWDWVLYSNSFVVVQVDLSHDHI